MSVRLPRVVAQYSMYPWADSIVAVCNGVRRSVCRGYTDGCASLQANVGLADKELFSESFPPSPSSHPRKLGFARLLDTTSSMTSLPSTLFLAGVAPCCLLLFVFHPSNHYSLSSLLRTSEYLNRHHWRRGRCALSPPL